MDDERIIAGHRVLRLLARGERSRVWLAADDRVLKVLTQPLGRGQPAAEAEALHRARGEHVVELLDVSADDERAVLVFARLPRGSLAEVLAVRAGLDAGEAVTALVPVAAALARMHGAGVAHGALSPSNVLLRDDAAPVLVGFGHAQLFEPGLAEVHRERQPGVIADREALAALAVAVLSRVTGPRAAAAASLAERLARGSSLLDLEVRLQQDLFDLAAARPIVTVADAVEPVVGRAVSVAAVVEPDPPGPPDRRAGVYAWIGEWLAPALESGPATLVRRRVRAVWAGWSARRRRLALGGAMGGIALLIAATAIPAAEPQAVPYDVPAAETAPPLPQEAAPSVVTGDDPLAALPALLDRRLECFRDLSVLCLDDVDQQGSAALDDDRAAIDAVLDGGVAPAMPSTEEATVVERLGDSVLISLGPDSDPASVLLMKGEAGWRIRDYLDGA